MGGDGAHLDEAAGVAGGEFVERAIGVKDNAISGIGRTCISPCACINISAKKVIAMKVSPLKNLRCR